MVHPKLILSLHKALQPANCLDHHVDLNPNMSPKQDRTGADVVPCLMRLELSAPLTLAFASPWVKVGPWIT